MMTQGLNHNSQMPGTARLPIVVPVAVLSFFYASVLEYSLPLYFGALGEVAEARGGFFPADIWSKLVKYQVTPWVVGPILAGLLARRYGERIVWSGALLGKMIVPLLLAIHPEPNMIKLLALWQGFTGALMWIAGISLIQMVAPEKKGLSNGLMMASIGVGSLLGPLGGRVLIYRQELSPLVSSGSWGEMWSRLFSFTPMTMTPNVSDFHLIFWILTATTFVCGVLVGLWGQHPGRFEQEVPAGWSRTLHDIGRLARTPKFWALVIALCLLGGPVFQASNQFLPFRAEDLGLKSGARDDGWIWLQLLKTLMWIPGGLAVGRLAGRRAPGIAAVIMLASFSLAALGIGMSGTAFQIFVYVAIFEFTRQFMRWSHAGYLSEHLPGGLRTTAIGFSITFSGLGSAIYAWAADALWDPATQSSQPIYAAALLGGVGCVGLFVFDRLRPIREPESVSSVSGEPVVAASPAGE